MKKLIKYLSILFLLTQCSYSFEDLELVDSPISITLSSTAESNGTEITVRSSMAGDYLKLKIEQAGFCYLFDTSVIPDTSAYTKAVALLTTTDGRLSPNFEFNANIEYSPGNNTISVVSFIIFGDIIKYSDHRVFNLTH
jgi:hypothetical protein